MARSFHLVFRNLMFFYNTREGMHVFVPSARHRARLLDMWTGAVIPLSQSHVRLEVDGAPITDPTPLVDPGDRVVTLEWLANMPAGSLKVPKDLMDVANVPESLCAHVSVGGGELTAYPLAMFPELDRTKALFERTLGQKPDEHYITDTLIYHLDLSTTSNARLVVSGPRRAEVSIDVSDGGRFQIYNEDDKIGPMGTMAQQRQDEVDTILGLLGLGSPACDIHACAGFYGGDPTKGDPV